LNFLPPLFVCALVREILVVQLGDLKRGLHKHSTMGAAMWEVTIVTSTAATSLQAMCKA
jgi:hypothetical protein